MPGRLFIGIGSPQKDILFEGASRQLKTHRVALVDGRLERRRFSLYTELFGLSRNGVTLDNGFGSFHCFHTRSGLFSFLAPGAQMDPLELYSHPLFPELVRDIQCFPVAELVTDVLEGMQVWSAKRGVEIAAELPTVPVYLATILLLIIVLYGFYYHAWRGIFGEPAADPMDAIAA
mgnify:CR=1 FL=1